MEHSPENSGFTSDKSNRQDSLRIWRSEDLFEGNREVLIEHLGETYRLRQTRNGRLILQK